MNLAVTAPGWLVLLLVALLVVAAVQDAWRLRISNSICAAILIAAVVAAIIAGPRLALWQNMVLVISLLAVGTPLFAAGRMGGGDVKLIAACSAWFNLASGLLMLVCTLLTGGLLALIILGLRAFTWPDAIQSRAAILKAGSGIPYGVAIATGTMLATSLKLA